MTDQSQILPVTAPAASPASEEKSSHRCYVDDAVDGDDACAFDGDDFGSCDEADNLSAQGLCKADCPYWRQASAVADASERSARQAQTKALIRMDAANMRELATQASLDVAMMAAQAAPEFKGSFGHGAYYRCKLR